MQGVLDAGVGARGAQSVGWPHASWRPGRLWDLWPLARLPGVVIVAVGDVAAAVAASAAAEGAAVAAAIAVAFAT